MSKMQFIGIILILYLEEGKRCKNKITPRTDQSQIRYYFQVTELLITFNRQIKAES